MTTRVEYYEVKKMKLHEPVVTFVFIFENGEKLEFEMTPEVGYNFGSKLRNRIERAAAVPEGGNGEKYSQFYGMQY